ncbi:MAG: hypothetical protein JXR36_01855 [Bacteroidales bacterium]|nr:hypothetical protein [Bacteroidales bacterium]
MSEQKEQILLITGINTDTNIDVLIETIEKTLHKFNNKTITKRILACSIELIQNNIIHNKNKPSEIIISETEDTIDLKISQSILFYDAQNILKIINSINQNNIEALKIIYRQNLSGEEKTTGNGLIICRIKSENKIKFNCTNSDLYEIILKFNKL